MSSLYKICEHESIEWIVKKIPTFSRNLFSKSIKRFVTSFDVNEDVCIFGTNIGYLYYINRESEDTQSFLLKKDTTICQIKIIQTITLSIAAGLENGSVFILKIPIKNIKNFTEHISQFTVPVDHTSFITFMTWSKNSEKLFTGDNAGRVCCTEVDEMNKKVSSYNILDTSSPITQLCYSYKCLLISNEVENFIFDFSTNSRVSIGSKPRNKKGRYGGCFIDKLCRPEEVEIVVIRPDSKVWISDLNGIIKRTILLKNETLFSSEKAISLLPCVTSQSNNDFNEKIQSGISRYQLGLVTAINDHEVIFWSENGLIIFDISTGKVVSSSCNLGVILSVSICHINMLISQNSTGFSVSSAECKHSSEKILEIWILRKPIRVEESSLVRLSMIPLMTSKLNLDTFYDLSTSLKGTYTKEFVDIINESNLSSSSDLLPASNIISAEENPSSNTPEKIHEKWLPPIFDINVSDKIQEITKITKEMLKQSHEIFENTNEGVEQALELTEEGLIIEFDKNVEECNTFNIIFDPSLEIKDDDSILSNSINKNHRKVDRKINVIDLDNTNVEESHSSFTSIIDDYPIEHETASDVINTASEIMSCEKIWSLDQDEDFNFSGEGIQTSLYEELLPVTKECDFENSSYESNHANMFPEDDTKVEFTGDSESSSSIFNCTPSNNESEVSTSYIKNELDLNQNITSDVQFNMSHSYEYKDNFKDKFVDEGILLDNLGNNIEDVTVKEKPVLTNELLSNCNKWISHRGPLLSGSNKMASIAINRRMIWVTDTLGTLYVGFNYIENQDDLSIGSSHFQWFQNNSLPTDRIFSSPEGVILWREKSGEISVYTGITKIWTKRVVQEKVLLKSNWEQTMYKIKDVDIDNDMAVIVTEKGQLKVMNDISSRVAYKQTTTASITGHVTLATAFNGIIWCVTEIVDPETKKTAQHIFACFAKDDNNKLNISYWRTVPIPKDLIDATEEHLGILGGSSQIKYIQLGNQNLAWIVTLYNLCFFSSDVSAENPTGDGIWYQISMNFLYQVASHNDESRFKKVNSNNIVPSVLISAKGIPKRSNGNGLLWVTTIERNAPCMLFESDKDILGHHWVDCFSNEHRRNSITSLPPILEWSNVTFGFKNVIWLVNNMNEIFCYWNETRIRNVAVPSSFGKVREIATHGCTVAILTLKSWILVRIGITNDNPTGTDWAKINNTFSTNKETIKNISCFENEVWAVTAENIFYNDDLRSSLINPSKISLWKSFDFKLNDSFSSLQVASVFSNKKFIWSVSDPGGFVYLGIWEISLDSFNWIYIPGPKAKSIHLSEENLWMIEEVNGDVYVRCGINFEHKPTGDYWIHIPVTTAPVKRLAVSPDNHVVVIDCKQRLLSHKWTIVQSKAKERQLSNELYCDKSPDGDWELLN